MTSLTLPHATPVLTVGFADELSNFIGWRDAAEWLTQAGLGAERRAYRRPGEDDQGQDCQQREHDVPPVLRLERCPRFGAPTYPR